MNVDNNLRTALMKFGIINWMLFYFVDEEGVDREEDDSYIPSPRTNQRFVVPSERLPFLEGFGDE